MKGTRSANVSEASGGSSPESLVSRGSLWLSGSMTATYSHNKGTKRSDS